MYSSLGKILLKVKVLTVATAQRIRITPRWLPSSNTAYHKLCDVLFILWTLEKYGLVLNKYTDNQLITGILLLYFLERPVYF